MNLAKRLFIPKGTLKNLRHYYTRAATKQENCEYIEIFYNRQRKQGNLWPADFARQFFTQQFKTDLTFGLPCCCPISSGSEAKIQIVSYSVSK